MTNTFSEMLRSLFLQLMIYSGKDVAGINSIPVSAHFNAFSYFGPRDYPTWSFVITPVRPSVRPSVRQVSIRSLVRPSGSPSARYSNRQSVRLSVSPSLEIAETAH